MVSGFRTVVARPIERKRSDISFTLDSTIISNTVSSYGDST